MKGSEAFARTHAGCDGFAEFEFGVSRLIAFVVARKRIEEALGFLGAIMKVTGLFFFITAISFFSSSDKRRGEMVIDFLRDGEFGVIVAIDGLGVGPIFFP